MNISEELCRFATVPTWKLSERLSVAIRYLIPPTTAGATDKTIRYTYRVQPQNSLFRPRCNSFAADPNTVPTSNNIATDNALLKYQRGIRQGFAVAIQRTSKLSRPRSEAARNRSGSHSTIPKRFSGLLLNEQRELAKLIPLPIN
jgi:hypothetical protein